MDNDSVVENMIVDEASAYVQNLLQTKLGHEFQYHDLSHTQDVVEASEILSDMAGISPNEHEILLLSAWFHDTGYTETTENHEKKSAEIAEKWLKEKGYDADARKEITNLILSTKKGAPKPTFLAEILHDADLSHLGRKRFFDRGEMLRNEQSMLFDKNLQ